MIKILIADDEENIRKLIKDLLINEGFHIIEAQNGEEACSLFDENKDIALAILDVMMPKKNGYEVCEYIKENSEAPVIILTAKSDVDDELESFNKGANDYISKPFSLSVLLARVKSHLKHFLVKELSLLDIYVNLDAHEVFLKDKKVPLTAIEYAILVFLLKNKGIAFSRDELLEKIWGYEYFDSNRTVDTHIGRLRKKINSGGHDYIKTVRGYGYKLDV